MTTMVSQITNLAVVYSTVYLDADQRKHQSSASLAFVWGIHRDRWIPHTKGQFRGKCFHLMTSSWVCKRCHNRALDQSAGNRKQYVFLRFKIIWCLPLVTWYKLIVSYTWLHAHRTQSTAPELMQGLPERSRVCVKHNLTNPSLSIYDNSCRNDWDIKVSCIRW